MEKKIGWWFPDNDTTMQMYFEETESGYDFAVDAKNNALNHFKRKTIALDVGAHIGTWTKFLAKHFKTVYAYEPVVEHFKCLRRNVTDKNVKFFNYGLGNTTSTSFELEHEDPTNSGSARLVESKTDSVLSVKKLDDLNFDRIDFIKIDTEGFEKYVLEGGIETLKRCKPVMVIEVNNSSNEYYNINRDDIMNLLYSIGYKYKRNIDLADWVLDFEHGFETPEEALLSLDFNNSYISEQYRKTNRLMCKLCGAKFNYKNIQNNCPKCKNNKFEYYVKFEDYMTRFMPINRKQFSELLEKNNIKLSDTEFEESFNGRPLTFIPRQ